MIKHQHARGALSVTLIIIGAILIFLAPNDLWVGAAPAAAGIVIELTAFVIARRTREKD